MPDMMASKSSGQRGRFLLRQAVYCLIAAIWAAIWAGLPARATAAALVTVVQVEGTVEVRRPSKEAFSDVRTGDRIGHGSRIRTADDGKVVLQFGDGTKARVMPKSEVVVRAPGTAAGRPNGVVLFFGRLWTSVVKSVSGQETFEVRGANAVAGVRGTEFEVGIADDGAVRVVVSEGQVDVRGDRGDRVESVKPGFMVDSDPRGRLQERRKTPETLDWDGWFARRARVLEQRGQAVAKNLHGRLDRRKQKVEALIAQQKQLREQIEALEQQKRTGASVDAELQRKLRQLQRVTDRLEDMQRRLQAVFGIFDMWGRKASEGSMPGGEQISLLARDVKRVEKGFADLFEEGTDLSEEGLEEMIEQMQDGPTLKPKKSVKDELF